MSERPYLSIGEVLALLLEEFPDVTISKIRFLESQGLIAPERTPSGYRKFTETEDCYGLFVAAREIWKAECSEDKPLQRDYPLSLSLGIPKPEVVE